MTKPEFDEMAALVVRLRKELEDATQGLSLHYDALTQSNAQCAEYLRHNEMLAADRATLHRELVEVRAALAATTEQRDSLKRTLKEWEEAETKPHVRVAADDIADHVVPPVIPRCEVCHGCGSALVACSNSGLDCQNRGCNRTCTTDSRGGMSPWAGACKQQHAVYPVRHE